MLTVCLSGSRVTSLLPPGAYFQNSASVQSEVVMYMATLCLSVCVCLNSLEKNKTAIVDLLGRKQENWTISPQSKQDTYPVKRP